MTDLDAIKNRLAAVHAAGASGITVRLADHGIRVLVQSWEGNTAHEAHGAVTHLLGHAPADLTALVAEVERLHAEVSYLRACVPPTHPTDYGHEVWTAALRAEVAAERAAVVSWLRECALDPETTGAEMRLLQEHASRVERGEHRREEEK